MNRNELVAGIITVMIGQEKKMHGWNYDLGIIFNNMCGSHQNIYWTYTVFKMINIVIQFIYITGKELFRPLVH